MARNVNMNTLENKITKQKEAVTKAKTKYDAAVSELKQLMDRRAELQKTELLSAIEANDKSIDEIMAFLPQGNELCNRSGIES